MTITIPIFPLGTVLFPTCHMPLHIFEARYQRMMAEHADAPIPFGITLVRDMSPEGGIACADIGTAALIAERYHRPDGRWDIQVEGYRRFRILNSDPDGDYATATVEWLDDDPPLFSVEADRLAELRHAFAVYRRTLARLTPGEQDDWIASGAALHDVWNIASRLPLNTWQQQALLEERNPPARLDMVAEHVWRERALLTVGISGKPVMSGARFVLN